MSCSASCQPYQRLPIAGKDKHGTGHVKTEHNPEMEESVELETDY